MKNFIKAIWITILTRLFGACVIITKKLGEKLIKAKSLDNRTLKEKLVEVFNYSLPIESEAYSNSEVIQKYKDQILRNRQLSYKLREGEVVGSLKRSSRRLESTPYFIESLNQLSPDSFTDGSSLKKYLIEQINLKAKDK